MRTLNVVNPASTKAAWDIVMYAVASGFDYDIDLVPMMKVSGSGVYVSAKQYQLLEELFNETVALDIGNRQNETYPN